MSNSIDHECSTIYQLQNEWYTLRNLQNNEESLLISSSPDFDSTLEFLQSPHMTFLIVNIEFMVENAEPLLTINFPIRCYNNETSLYPITLLKSKTDFETEYYMTSGFIFLKNDQLCIKTYRFEQGFKYKISTQLFFRTK